MKIKKYLLAIVVSVVVYWLIQGVFVGLMANNILCLDWGRNCFSGIGRLPALAFSICVFLYLIPQFKYSKYIRLMSLFVAVVIYVLYIFNNWKLFSNPF